MIFLHQSLLGFPIIFLVSFSLSTTHVAKASLEPEQIRVSLWNSSRHDSIAVTVNWATWDNYYDEYLDLDGGGTNKGGDGNNEVASRSARVRVVASAECPSPRSLDACLSASSAREIHTTWESEQYDNWVFYHSQWTTSEHYESPYFHSVVVDDLCPLTSYRYQISGGARAEAWGPSSPLSFVTPSLPGQACQRYQRPSPEKQCTHRVSQACMAMRTLESKSGNEDDDNDDDNRSEEEHSIVTKNKNENHQFQVRDQPQRFALVGDLGQTNYSVQTIRHMIREVHERGLELALVVGDLSYNDGSGGQRWDEWSRLMQPLTASVPLMVLPGNHEVERNSHTKEVFIHYTHRFKMPGKYYGGGGEITMAPPRRQLQKQKPRGHHRRKTAEGKDDDDDDDDDDDGKDDDAEHHGKEEEGGGGEEKYHSGRAYHFDEWNLPFGGPPDLHYPYNADVKYEGGSSYYSFDSGLVHFTCLNTYNSHDLAYAMHDAATRGDEEENRARSWDHVPMLRWLREDLEAVDRQITPWVVVAVHAPFYSSNHNHLVKEEPVTARLKRAAEPLFNKFRVNLVFAGHIHAYERSYPVKNVDGGKTLGGSRVLNGEAPIYITIGDGGNYEELAWHWQDPSPEWSAT